MSIRSTRIAAAIGLVAYCLLFSAARADNTDDRFHNDRSDYGLTSSEEMAFDALIIRPVSLVSTVAGTAIYTISLPFSLLGGNERQAREKLIYEPARYTFKRPLGDFEY